MSLNEECGIFGVFGDPLAAQTVYYGLHSLQHRGQEGAGITTSDGTSLFIKKGEGLVNEVFAADSFIELPGDRAIGHVRYSTVGSNNFENIQPLLFRSGQGDMALAHNGELVNAAEIRTRLEQQGSIFQTTSDTEILAHLIRRSLQPLFRDKVRDALHSLVGGFAFIILTPNELIAASDPNGLRPLALGDLNGAPVISSESCAFDIVGASFVRDVQPGEMIYINRDGMQSEFFEQGKQHLCSMEYIYFSRPDSILDGITVHAARKAMGKSLARELPAQADIVIGVPDSSTSAAIGFAEESNIPYEMGLIKNRYVARTFIQPSQELRERGVKMKLSAVRGIVENKRLIVVDDSIVRGTTMKRIVRLLRESGAKEIHLRISSPPLIHPCFYGIDMHSYDELLSARMTPDEIADYLNADSVQFLSLQGMLSAISDSIDVDHCRRCLACFIGQYPTPVPII